MSFQPVWPLNCCRGHLGGQRSGDTPQPLDKQPGVLQGRREPGRGTCLSSVVLKWSFPLHPGYFSDSSHPNESVWTHNSKKRSEKCDRHDSCFPATLPKAAGEQGGTPCTGPAPRPPVHPKRHREQWLPSLWLWTRWDRGAKISKAPRSAQT